MSVLSPLEIASSRRSRACKIRYCNLFHVVPAIVFKIKSNADINLTKHVIPLNMKDYMRDY
jgi:hypothetical protein